MGLYLRAGHEYSDVDPARAVNGVNLNEHVNEATFLPTAISGQELRDPAEGTDNLLVEADGALHRIQLSQVLAVPGMMIQEVYSETVTNTDLVPIIPIDDSIPQITEGTEILTATITPQFSNSIIRVRYDGDFSPLTAQWGVCALFKNAVAGAVRAYASYNLTAGGGIPLHLVYREVAGTTSPITYRVRIGPGGATTLRINGVATQRELGGVWANTLTVEEIKQ